MCGLVGFFGKWSLDREKMFKDLLRLGVLRGPHSTGVGFAGINGVCTYIKTVDAPDMLFINKKYKQITDKGWYNLYMGHNRSATIGKIKNKNAHPFNFKTVLGCHNGTLSSRWELENNSNFNTDSENIFYLVDKIGIKETYKQLRGAVALVWWDKTEKSLNFIRNFERPLVYAWTKEKDGIIWASEGWMIKVAAQRHKIEHGKIYDIGVHKHYKINYMEDKEKFKGKITIKKKKLKPFVIPVQKITSAAPYDEAFCNTYDQRIINSKNRQHSLNYDTPNNTGSSIVPFNCLNKQQDHPIVGQYYSFYPRRITKTRLDGKIYSYTVYCGFQNLHKKYEAKIMINDKVDFYLAELYPSSVSMFDKVFFKGRITSAYQSPGFPELTYIIAVGSIDVIIPRDCQRKTKNGVLLDKEKFDKMYKDCGFCGDPLIFEDREIEFDNENYGIGELAICGNCAMQYGTEEGKK